MEHFAINTALITLLGFLIRWLFHLSNSYNKVVKKREDTFDFRFYFRDNIITIILSMVCTIALYILVPFILDYFQFGNQWGLFVAFGCGMSNLEITELVRNTFLEKVSDKSKKRKSEEN